MIQIQAMAVLTEIAIDFIFIDGSKDYSDSSVTHFHNYVSKYCELYREVL